MCGRGGGVLKGWRCVGEVEVCERGGDVCGELEVCGRGGGVLKGWRCVGEVEVCERGGGV